jgi:hypothetical protein
MSGTAVQRGLHSLVLLSVALAGCATTPRGNPDLLAFLDHEPVSKTEVLAHLGEPSEPFDADGVLTYRLTGGKDGLSVQRSNPKSGWEGVSYDLVLAFDASGILQRHTLVAVRP